MTDSMVRWYGTRFRVDEDPLSEGGLWICGAAAGADWTDVVVSGGVAYGAVSRLGVAGHHAGQGPASDFDDPTAVLAGDWGGHQRVKATVFSRNPTQEYRQEVEIRLRSRLSPHRCTGYEVLWRCLKAESAYAEIVRWNGAPGDFTVLRRLVGENVGVEDGDVVEASISGGTLKGFINGVEVIAATDDTYDKGGPGIGFNSGVGTTNTDHGITCFEVYSYGD
jgi:hypothetical protein